MHSHGLLLLKIISFPYLCIHIPIDPCLTCAKTPRPPPPSLLSSTHCTLSGRGGGPKRVVIVEVGPVGFLPPSLSFFRLSNADMHGSNIVPAHVVYCVCIHPNGAEGALRVYSAQNGATSGKQV